jgi:membrane protein
MADAGLSFARNDGLAMASHVALSLVIALFPFLICVAALAAFLGAGRISTHIVHLLFDFWPEGVAGPLAREADKVLIPRRNVLTISIVLTLLVATNGVESLRVALCRAYGVERFRPWWQARLIGVGFILIGAGALVASSVLVVLWPSIWRGAVSYMPDLKGLGPTYDVVRYGLASLVLVAGLSATHLWLPDTRPRSWDVVPGIATTLVLWLTGASLYGEFLANMAHLKSTYAGLAGILRAQRRPAPRETNRRAGETLLHACGWQSGSRVSGLGAHAFVPFPLAIPLRGLLRSLLLLGKDRIVSGNVVRMGRNGEGCQDGKGDDAKHGLSFLGRSPWMLRRSKPDGQPA